MRIRALSVSELNKYIKKILSSDPILNNITLKGEISNLKVHSSGHLYFSLKDDQSKINCVMFKESSQSIKFDLTNGMKVITKGYVSIFERNGQYQMYIMEMEPDGIGALYLAFEQLKAKLEKEGLFDLVRKKKIPAFPKKIAVITSPTGAAIRDIISVLKRRNDAVDILIYPVLVQGENASFQIAQGIEKVNSDFKNVNLIIIGRGGGSIEELWPFNEEVVARSIAHSKIPIISAVGHETDYTISDFVADLRAPTPSAGAELAVPRTLDIRNSLGLFYNKMNTSLTYYIKEKRNEVERVNEIKLLSFVQDKINRESQTLDLLQKDLSHHTRVKVEAYKTRLIGSMAKLEGINPLATILRGYAIVFDTDRKKTIDSIQQASEGDHINIMLTDGVLSCKVTEKEKEDPLFEYFQKYNAKIK
ncbi:exodeoxyribonuclease VII large subunit [Marinisporobacter balticus]|uniref:Exodeoxyribonuclease 7 large subunit n=1 Tax=Marinisporobacter balticus TaxID=2018667 RepID=A0A4R2L5K9_9FIRM|nr:exodeoxyribonuclease VII large subunit [Marinisporobacter balticus]TCO79196.1 exodeoxyribonuclease VII large subunit [Marinisporobacter balticus]